MQDLLDYKETLDPSNRAIYDLFEKYKPDSGIFVETGCHLGGGLTKAVHVGFTKLYSCDINLERVEHSIELMSEMAMYGSIVDPCIFNSESTVFLMNVLPMIQDDQVMFWLDAHDEGGGIPVLQELDLMKAICKNKTSSILIDDVPLYLEEEGVDYLKKTILEINENYEFEKVETNDGGNYVIAAGVVEKEEK